MLRSSNDLVKFRRDIRQSIEILGTEFLFHHKNHHNLQFVLQNENHLYNLYQQLMVLVYRLLFLLILEHRNVLFSMDSQSKCSDDYFIKYSLRSIIERKEHFHETYWNTIIHIMRCLYKGNEVFRITSLRSHLWEDESCHHLLSLYCSNDTIVSSLSSIISLIDISSESLGNLHEYLLEMTPVQKILLSIFMNASIKLSKLIK